MRGCLLPILRRRSEGGEMSDFHDKRDVPTAEGVPCACRFERREDPDFSGRSPVQLDECGFHSEQRRKAERELAEAKANALAAWQSQAEWQRRADSASAKAEQYLDLLFRLADDGLLMHGEEGMDPLQEDVYAAIKEHPEYKRSVANSSDRSSQ